MVKAKQITLEGVKNAYENFVLSKYYNASLFFIICVCYLFSKEDIGFLILMILIISNCILVEDIMPMILPLVGMCIIVLRLYDGWEKLFELWPLAICAVIALAFHFVYYKKKIKKSKILLPLLAVSVALLAGGLFVISAKEYFSFNAIYYTIGLGPGMIGFYLLFRHYLNPQKKYNTFEAIADIANTIGGIVIAMLVIQYVQNVIPKINAIPVWEPQQIWTDRIIGGPLQFGNNLSTVLLMVTPFSFYKAKETKWKNYVYTTLGSVECLAMIFTMSRSGIVFGMLFIIFYAIYLFNDSKLRKKFKSSLAFALPIIIMLIVIMSDRRFWQFLFTLAFNSQAFPQDKLLLLLLGVVISGIGLYVYLDIVNRTPAKRKTILMISEIVFIVGVAILVLFWKYLFDILLPLGGTRVEMADVAIKNLFKYPLFGTGMGYTGMQDIYNPHGLMLNAYHCIIFQVIGSMGMVGMLAYGYFFHKKYDMLFQVNNGKFFYFILPIIGLHAMSLINPGVMMPLSYAMFEILILAIAENYLDEKAAKCI